MKYYSQYRSHDLFELRESLLGLSKSNRWVKLADHLPWDRIEGEYNKRLRNSHNGAGNKPARMVVGALIVKHVEKLSDEKSIQAIQENLYMQYLIGLEKFTKKPVFVPELLVLVRKRLDHDFFNMLTLMLAEADGSKPKKEHTDEDGNDHGGTMKIDATCCDAEDKKRAIGERNEIEGTFGTTKRVYRADDIRVKLDQTADTWIGACFFAKNIIKFLRGLLCFFLKKQGRETSKRVLSSNSMDLQEFLPYHELAWLLLVSRPSVTVIFYMKQMVSIT